MGRIFIPFNLTQKIQESRNHHPSPLYFYFRICIVYTFFYPHILNYMYFIQPLPDFFCTDLDQTCNLINRHPILCHGNCCFPFGFQLTKLHSSFFTQLCVFLFPGIYIFSFFSLNGFIKITHPKISKFNIRAAGISAQWIC